MKDGFYVMHRGWLDNPALDGKAYCEKAAWIWLVENAQWKAGDAQVLGKKVSLRRGQLSFAHRYLGRVWGWSEASVRRFLGTLEVFGMVELSYDLGQTLITLVDYDESQMHQGDSDARMTQDGRGKDANTKEPLREESVSTAHSAPDPRPPVSASGVESVSLTPPALEASPADEQHVQGTLLQTGNVVAINNTETRFAAFYAAYPKKVKRKEARAAYVKALRIATHEQIMEGLARFQFSAEPKWRPHPASWLNGERWLDEVQAAPPHLAVDNTRQQPAADPKDPFGVQAWAKALPGIRPTESEFERRAGNWKNADAIVDYWALAVCDAAGFAVTDRPDLTPILAWMKGGIDADKAADLIRDKLAWWRGKSDAPITSLRFFDKCFEKRGVA